jgi:hypothetical protein
MWSELAEVLRELGQVAEAREAEARARELSQTG